jgi:hypothetical protein
MLGLSAPFGDGSRLALPLADRHRSAMPRDDDVIDQAHATAIAQDWLATYAAHDALSYAGLKWVEHNLDPTARSQVLLEVWRLTGAAVAELAELQDCSVAEAVERLA